MTTEPPAEPPADPPKRKRPAGPGRGHKVKVGPWAGSGVGVGDGWGGPPKGKGAGPEALLHGAERVAATAAKALSEAQIAAEMRDKLLTLARTAEREETQLSAANALLNRIEGAPIARNINASIDDVSRLSDDELRDQLARTGRTGA